MTDKKVVVLDIDNTLVDYTAAWLKFIKARTGLTFSTIIEAKEGLDRDDYVNMKEEYRASGRKRDLELMSPAIPALLNRLVEMGWRIAIVSSRPAYKNPMVAQDTLIWLVAHSIPTDYIYFTEDKHLLIERLFKDCSHCYVIEDEIEFAEKISASGFTVMLVNPEAYCQTIGLNVFKSTAQALETIIYSETQEGREGEDS